MRELARMVILYTVGASFVGAALTFLITGHVPVGRGPIQKLVRRRTDPLGYWAIVIFSATVGVAAFLLLAFNHPK
jgi:hypothetical protein